MARPKGSKNKSTVEQETAPQAPPVPFNYEEDDAKFDSAYQQRYNHPVPYGLDEFNSHIHAFPAATGTVNMTNVEVSKLPSKLFLVEGEVQLSSRMPGRGAMVAKQMRLVEAPNDDVAIQKFVNYFNGLSDAQSVYAVMNAAAMETIR